MGQLPHSPKGTDNRPYITFKRKKNRGLSFRDEKVIKSGRQKGEMMPSFPGESWEEWRCSLVSHRHGDPFVWATKDWLLSKIKPDCLPIDCGNMDKLPADYPREWRLQLQSVMEAVGGIAKVNRETAAAQEAIAARERALEEKAKALDAKVKQMEEQASKESTNAPTPIGSGSQASRGKPKSTASEALAATGQASES